MKHCIHVEFITGSIVRTELDAPSAEEARAKQLAKFPVGTVRSIAAWPFDRSPVTVNLGGHRTPVFDSAFGALV